MPVVGYLRYRDDMLLARWSVLPPARSLFPGTKCSPGGMQVFKDFRILCSLFLLSGVRPIDWPWNDLSVAFHPLAASRLCVLT